MSSTVAVAAAPQSVIVPPDDMQMDEHREGYHLNVDDDIPLLEQPRGDRGGGEEGDSFMGGDDGEKSRLLEGDGGSTRGSSGGGSSSALMRVGGWPSGTSNQLKLSVGCDEEEEEDSEGRGDSQDELRGHLAAWQQACAPSSSRAAPQNQSSPLPVDRFDELAVSGRFEGGSPADFASLVSNMLTDCQPMFQQVPENNFVEEVWQEKRPKVLHGYLFGAVIGEGSYAKVKEVVEEFTLVRRAVKILKEKRLRKIPGGVDNVERELNILRKVNHKNVIRMIEWFRDDGKQKQYFVMEYCVGSVQQVLEGRQGGHVSEATAHRWFGEMMAGLEYIHSVGVVHKDIKPGNLLLALDRTLKITDFGVAEELSMYQSDDKCVVSQGTPKFQPPEVVSGNSSWFYGFAVDVWAAGVTLYNMLSGEYPFEGEVIMKLFDNIANQELAMPKSVRVDKDCAAILHGMLEKEPTARWSVARILSHDWSTRAIPYSPLDDDEYFMAPEYKGMQPTRPLSVYPELVKLFGEGGPGERRDASFEARGLEPVGSALHVLDEGPQGPAVVRPAEANGPRGTAWDGPEPRMPNEEARSSRDDMRPRRNRSLLNCFRSGASP